LNAARHFEKNPVNATILDQQDPLKEFRKEFYIPKRNNTEVIYFCGNSLGLQPKITSSKIDHELKNGQKRGLKDILMKIHGFRIIIRAKQPWPI